MKIVRILLGMLAAVIAAASVWVAVNCRDDLPILAAEPEEAAVQVQKMMDALCEGAFSEVESLLYGQPDLGMNRKAEGSIGRMIWDAYVDSLDYEVVGSLYATRTGLAQDVKVISMETESVTKNLDQRVQILLQQRVEAAESVSEIYNAENPVYQIPQKLAPTIHTRIDSEDQPDLSGDRIIQHALRQLYTTKDKKQAVNSILALMGKQMNASRVYVFENDADGLSCSNTYEWCNEGIAPEIDNLQHISYETVIPNFEANFDEYGIFYCPDVDEQPRHIQDILKPQGIKSMINCAIRNNNNKTFYGFNGFEDCHAKRYWTKDQIHTLSLFSEMLGAFLLKERVQAQALNHMEDLTSILDNQQAWIYVIDPDTCELQFLNAKTRSIAPDAQLGMTCHEAIMGRSERCEFCPARNIYKAKNCSQDLMNPYLNLHMHSDATLIRWNGKDACLLSCREMDK